MTIARRLLVALLALMIAAPALAQLQRSYSQAELDQMLAPIALYPDPLLSQVLMAATYPRDVAEAARWSRANPGQQGDDAVRAAQNEGWDSSVQSLVAFPQILASMDENPGWVLALGDAFLMQEPQMMDAVQQLRQRAQAAGNLQSSEQIVVQQQGQTIVLQPSAPQYVYVPYYDPLVVYGIWWWPAYRPVRWAPWPGYARPHRPGLSAGFWWGAPVGVPVNFFFGNFDWRQRQVHVVHPAAYYYRAPVVVNRTIAAAPHRWQHDPQVQDRLGTRVPDGPRRTVVNPAPAARTAPAAAPVAPLPPVRIEPRTEVRKQETRTNHHEDNRMNARFERVPALQVQARPQAQPQVRMPAAIAPQQPRAERREPRYERGRKVSDRT